MNILHIASGFTIDFNGGITNYVRSLAKTQTERGHKVYVLCDGGSDNCFSVINPPAFTNRWGYSGKKCGKQLRFLDRFLKDNHIDLIHVHMLINFDQRIWKVIQNNQINYVVSLHDYWLICPRIKMFKGADKRCENACSKRCDRCFSILESNYFVLRVFRRLFGTDFIEKFPIKSRSTYAHWIDNTKKILENAKYLLPVSYKVEQIFKESGINGDYATLHIGNITADSFDYDYVYKHGNKIRLVVLSSLSEAKGGKLFSEIIKKVDNPLLEIHFYGNATKSELDWFDGTILVNHGPYKQSDLKNILSSMDMGVMTPIWEDNAPQVVMEMINNHLPVFATKMGGIPDFINSSNGFLFNPFSDDEIADAVVFLNNLNFSIIEKMKSNITPTEKSTDHYKKLMEIYAKALKRYGE